MRRSGHEPRAGELRSFLSPAVSRLLAAHDLDPAAIEGTGRHGRITRRDVYRHLGIDAPEAAVPPPLAVSPREPDPPPADPEPDPSPMPTPVPPPDVRPVPFDRLRQRTADRMMLSLGAAAHTLVVTDVDYSAIEAVRAPAKEGFRSREGVPLTYLSFVARAVTQALARYPLVNATVGADELVVHRRVNLGIAVDLDFEGLVVPVIKDAHDLRLRGLAHRIAELSDKARRRKLSPDDVVGGTFTITNAGGYGTFITGPIINHPQAAIVSTDTVRMRPVAVETAPGEWGVAVHPVGNLSLSFDHRAFDGAYASAFLAEIKDRLEHGDWAGEL
jgi:2-oxoglutarate dehydrogenase E2 component (dihydrolipoamide succinyltransferase)